MVPGAQLVLVHNGTQVIATVPENATPGSIMMVQVPVNDVQATPVQATPAVEAVPATRMTGVAAGGGAHIIQINGLSGAGGGGAAQLRRDTEYAEKLLRSAWWCSCFAMMDVRLPDFFVFSSF